MRLSRVDRLSDHTQLQDVGENDHHPRGTFYTVIINAYTIPASSDYEHRVNLGSTGHKVLRGVLRGDQLIGGQGHTGCFFQASDTQQESIGMSSSYSSYVYMGCFSRLHGDSYLSHSGLFGSYGIYFLDAYIDGLDAVLVFRNIVAASRTLKVYGTIMVK